MEEVKRKGSKSTKDIPKEILEQLNNGQIETANLVEWLAVDQRLLLENLLKQTYRSKIFKRAYKFYPFYKKLLWLHQS